MEDADLKDWRQAYRRLQEAGSDACPPEEALAALAVGEAPEEQRAALADHVVACRRCAALYRDLLDLHQEAQRAGADVPATSPAPATALPRRRAAWAVAAAAAVAAVSLAGWNLALVDENRRLAADLAQAGAKNGGEIRPAEPRPADPAVQEALAQLSDLTRRIESQTEQIARLEGEVTGLRAPRINVPVVDLDPGTARGAGSEAGQTVAVPAGASLVTLILNPAERPAPGSYGLEILAADGRRIWSGAGLQPTPWDNFSLAIPRALLPDGRYRFRLTDPRGTALETYDVRIETQEKR
jgi:hypothetical protein